jgi:hypothetical protein
MHECDGGSKTGTRIRGKAIAILGLEEVVVWPGLDAFLDVGWKWGRGQCETERRQQWQVCLVP